MTTQLPQVILPSFDVAMKDAAQRHLFEAGTMVIKTDADYEAVAQSLKDSTARLRFTESGLDAHITPLTAAVKQIRELWATPIAAYRSAVQIKKRLQAEYIEAKQAARERLQRAADEAAAKERKRLEERAVKADARGDTDKAVALAHEAAFTIAPVVRADVPKIAGQSVREVWLFQIEDEAQLPRAYLMPDESKMRKYVNAMKADAAIPGVRIWSEKRIASGV